MQNVELFQTSGTLFAALFPVLEKRGSLRYFELRFLDKTRIRIILSPEVDS